MCQPESNERAQTHPAPVDQLWLLQASAFLAHHRTRSVHQRSGDSFHGEQSHQEPTDLNPHKRPRVNLNVFYIPQCFVLLRAVQIFCKSSTKTTGCPR